MTRHSFHRRALSSSTGVGVVLAILFLTSTAFALPSEETIAAFTEARDALDTDPAKAYERAAELEPIPHADDVRLRLLAAASLRAGRSDRTIEHLVALQKITDDREEKFELDLELAEVHFLLGQLESARKLTADLEGRQRSAGGRAADRRFLRSRLLRLRHDLELTSNPNSSKAVSYAKQLLVYYPAEDATRRPGLASSVDELSDRQRMERAENLYDAWSYHDARDEFERLSELDRYAEEARWHLGLIALRKLRDRPKEAQKIFADLSESSSKYAEKATYYLARSYMRQEMYDEALEVFDRYAERWPSGRHMLDVRYYRGWLPYDHRKNDEALAGLQAFIDHYGRRSYKSSYIYGFKAWALMREKRWKDAVKAWDDMMPFGNPVVAGKAMYWKAHALWKLGEDERAIASLDRLRERYPLTYYQVLGEMLRAEIETGEQVPASRVWWPERDAPADDSPRVDVVSREFSRLSNSEEKLWLRTKTLALLGEKHLARESFESIDDDLLREIPSDSRQEWIHAVGRFVGDYNEPWDVATGGRLSAMTTSVPDTDDLKWSMAYPRAYREVVGDVTDEFNLPGYLVWSIMRQESRYKPGAISFTNAVGALQMIPKTARLVARDLGTVYDVRTFFRPEVGFRFSGHYMRRLLDVFSGLYVPMAAAYNSGPIVVARWFDRNPDASFPWLIEEFEYNEGRAYCRKVAEHMLRYVYLYEKDEDRRKAILDQMFPLSRDIELPEDVGY